MFVLSRLRPLGATSSSFADSSYDIFNGDQSEADIFTEDSLNFISLGDNQDLDPVASNNQLDWGTDHTSYLNDGGDSQSDFDLSAANSACTLSDARIPGFDKKRELLSESCPNPSSSSTDTQTPSVKKQPNLELPDPFTPPDPKNPGIPYLDHGDLGDFLLERDQDTIRGWVPSKTADSICGVEKFTVCDSGDSYWRIPQVPPMYALGKCFICMYVTWAI